MHAPPLRRTGSGGTPAGSLLMPRTCFAHSSRRRSEFLPCARRHSRHTLIFAQICGGRLNNLGTPLPTKGQLSTKPSRNPSPSLQTPGPERDLQGGKGRGVYNDRCTAQLGGLPSKLCRCAKVMVIMQNSALRVKREAIECLAFLSVAPMCSHSSTSPLRTIHV